MRMSLVGLPRASGSSARAGAREGYARRLALVTVLITLTLAVLAWESSLAVAAPVASSLVNTIDTSAWSPPSPDPSGLDYDAARNRLLVSDGEVEEMSIYNGANYYEASLAGGLLRSANTLAFSHEPVGLTLNPGGRLFVSDDDQLRIFEVTVGSNGQFDASDPVRSFGTAGFGCGDPEGLAYDAPRKLLAIACGADSEIHVMSAGVDGVFGNGDDQVNFFDTKALGASDPETVEVNPESGTLFTIGSTPEKIVEVTTAGALVSEIDVSYLPLLHASGLIYAPRSTDPAKKSFYIADRKIDNGESPSENDGTIYEVAPASGGGAPSGDVQIAAGSDDAEESTGGSVNLTSSDLELVTDTSAQTVGLRFSDLAIPAGARITSAAVQFTADETHSEPTALTIRAQAADDAATFTTASQNVSARPRTSAATSWSPAAWTSGQAGANQRTPDLSAVVQEVVDRPGWASGHALALIITGSGRRAAVAYNGTPSKAPLLHVEFDVPTGNQAPRVDAGLDQTITLPAGATLDGTVSDDGRLNPTPSTTWSKVSGPGTVSFANAGAIDTAASFSVAGTYVLRLTADDGALSASDDVTITVNPQGPSSIGVRVAAGADDAEELNSTGKPNLTSTDLELVTDGSVQTVGLRFANLAIPKGRQITNAYVQFTADESQSVATTLSIQAQAADNAATFTTTSLNVSSRPRATAAVSWSPAAWSKGQAGASQRTPDLTALIQAVVDRPGWASGNALALIITGSGHRTAVANNGSATKAPLLHVEYQ
jgi:hypothetical protein